MQYQEYEVTIASHNMADETARVQWSLIVHATTRDAATDFVRAMFMQGAGSAVIAALPRYSGPYIKADCRPGKDIEVQA